MDVRRVFVSSYCLESSRRLSNAVYVMLLLCLIVVGCSCDLIEPKKEQKPAEAPVKMPLPQHGGQPPAVNIPAAPADKKIAVPAPGGAAKPAQVATTAASPAAPAVKPNAQKVVDVSPPNGKKALPAPNGSKEQKTAAAVKNEAKGTQQAKKIQPSVVEKKGVSVAGKTNAPASMKKQEEKAKTPVPVVKKKAHPVVAGLSSRKWTVVSGPYLLEEALATDLAKVSKAGFAASVKPGARKKSVMRRLLLAQFDDRAAAQVELDKLQKVTSDAFILRHGGKYTVYAGSYLLDSRAESEKERLAAAGFSLAVKRADVAIPSKRLVVGTYRDKPAAEAVAKKLKNAGIKDVKIHQ